MALPSRDHKPAGGCTPLDDTMADWQTGRQRPPFRIILFIVAEGQVPLEPVLRENPASVDTGLLRLESPKGNESSPGTRTKGTRPSPSP